MTLADKVPDDRRNLIRRKFLTVSIESTVRKSLDRFIPSGGRVVLGLSGGVDSVVLFDLVKKLRPDIEVFSAHFDHGFRPESYDDLLFCKQLAESNGSVFFSRSEDVPAFCRKNKIGDEEGARILRHQFFLNVIENTHADKLLLAHHEDDKTETVLFNFLRGTGLRGLSAMRESEHQNRIIRPLLGVRKKDILAYAQDKELFWREDSTNASTDYDRNWLRNVVIPELENRRPGVVSVIARNAEQFALVSDYMQEQALAYLKTESDVSKSGALTFAQINHFRDLHPALKNEIVSMLWKVVNGSGQNFSGNVLKEFNKWIDGPNKNGSACDFGPDVRLVNRDGRLGYKVTNPDRESVIRANISNRLDSVNVDSEHSGFMKR